MPTIRLETWIAAPPEICFDLERDIGLHVRSTSATGERAIAGTTAGRIGAGEWVTWEARHFGLRWRMTVRITEYEPPHRFVDEMTRGPFARFRHTHEFAPADGGTRMTDTLEFRSPFGPLGWLADRLLVAPHLTTLLRQRNAAVKAAAESEQDGTAPGG